MEKSNPAIPWKAISNTAGSARQKYIGYQLPKPKGKGWTPRSNDTAKWLGNYRNMLNHQLEWAEGEYKRAEEQDIGDPELEKIQRNLQKQYMKLYRLDWFNIATIDGKDGQPAELHCRPGEIHTSRVYAIDRLGKALPHRRHQCDDSNMYNFSI